MTRTRVLVVTAMGRELGPLVRPLGLRVGDSDGVEVQRGTRRDVEIVAAVTGIGTSAARSTVDVLVERHRPDRVVMVGIAGGVDHAVTIGSVIDPDRVIDAPSGRELRPDRRGPGTGGGGALLTSDELVNDPHELEALRRRGIVAVDMETAAVGGVCEAQGVPWSVIRAISDRAEELPIDPSGPRLVRDDGSADLRVAVPFLLRSPGRIPPLLRLARDVRAATRAAARETVAWLDSVAR